MSNGLSRLDRPTVMSGGFAGRAATVEPSGEAGDWPAGNLSGFWVVSSIGERTEV